MSLQRGTLPVVRTTRLCKNGCRRPVHGQGLCGACYNRWLKSPTFVPLPKRTLEERFWAKVDKTGPNECWIWTASLNDKGYGNIGLGGSGNVAYAHRVAYELVVGPIPHGLVLDHVCRTPACVNPAHLEPVTQEENLARSHLWHARRESCKYGHPFTSENTYTYKGTRHCRECDRRRSRDWQRRKRNRISGA